MRFAAKVACAVTLLMIGSQNEALSQRFRGGAHVSAGFGPRGGAYAGASHGGAAIGPYGGVHAGGAQHGTYVGPRGTTVQAGRAGGVGVGPYGGVHAGGVEGARVTTPGGRTYTTGSRAGATVGPYGGVHASAAHGAVAAGPYGMATTGYRGGFSVGPGGVAGHYHGGYAVGHATRYVSPGVLSANAAYVRGGYYHGVYTPTWFRAHPVAWAPLVWRAPSFWVAPVWPAVSAYCGIAAPPILYDYGSTTVIQNDYVYVDGQQTVPAPQYAEQAIQFSDKGRDAQPAKDDSWQPLGVFALVRGDEKESQNIFQLAVNKAGVVRGNYYDAIADNTLPVYGAVDPKTQRVAWSVGDKKTVVFEAGLNNLTKEQTTILVHYGTDRTQQMALVRLPDPGKDGEKK
jgi:hypothetical protein